ncbi:MAG: UDP-N-acetylglucosamine--N-acetylmuramyl-(pentapeptide) pyrophosphoryl-undecaprenol N-acetylglucosamine transferase, partial [Clostridia bacterium]|nr:UDP-N-acetylglucosamine--N-acetylmuramyl-(pentapeptide) pyrophosphoryl-undecaprenol N-acetylglucosamine transferase [Clostridia bacterium]
KRLKVPLVCHESDITMGLANRLTKNKCKLILTAFEETAQGIENGVYVGQPVRDEVLINKRAYALKKYGLSGKRPVVLVIGGSSGSKAINDLILDNLDALISKYDIIHICGDKHINGLKRRGYVQLGFETDMAAAYSASDLCVSRCGAGVAFELFARGIPTVFIPLPKACSRGDQIENAAYFEKRGLSLTLTEEQACIRALEKKLEYLEKNAALFKKRAAALDTVGAAKRVADIVCAAAAK